MRVCECCSIVKSALKLKGQSPKALALFASKARLIQRCALKAHFFALFQKAQSALFGAFLYFQKNKPKLN